MPISAILLAIAFLVNRQVPIRGNTQMPKIFVDVEIIKLIDPLRRGFDIILHQELIEHHLNPTKLPTIFVSIIPLRQGSEPEKRLMMYREDVQNQRIHIDGLTEKSWYYICVEFENVVRKHHQGNTSIACRVGRTLDAFGKPVEEMVRDLEISHIGSRSMEFQLTVDTNFPTQIMTYLESGASPLQMYVMTQPKTVRIQFLNLSPGFNYDRLCVIQQPLRYAYSMMGRDIHASKKSCYFEQLKTESASEIVEIFDDTVQIEPLASSLRLKQAPSSANTRQCYLPGVSMLVWHVFVLTYKPCAL